MVFTMPCSWIGMPELVGFGRFGPGACAPVPPVLSSLTAVILVLQALIWRFCIHHLRTLVRHRSDWERVGRQYLHDECRCQDIQSERYDRVPWVPVAPMHEFWSFVTAWIWSLEFSISTCAARSSFLIDFTLEHVDFDKFLLQFICGGMSETFVDICLHAVAANTSWHAIAFY